MAPRTLHDKPRSLPDGVPKDAVMVQFGARLQRALVEKGWSQVDLARAATKFMKEGEISRDTISKYVNAITLPGPDRLNAVSKALKMEPLELLPNRGVTAVSDKTPEFDMRATDSNHVWLRINQEITWEKGMKIMAILKEE